MEDWREAAVLRIGEARDWPMMNGQPTSGTRSCLLDAVVTVIFARLSSDQEQHTLANGVSDLSRWKVVEQVGPTTMSLTTPATAAHSVENQGLR
jgi:hypothetical protein